MFPRGESLSQPLSRGLSYVFFLSLPQMNNLCVGTVFFTFIICIPGWHAGTFFFLINESRAWSKLFTGDGKEWVNHGTLGISMICYSNDLRFSE